MPRGGPRANSGPPPDPDAIRRDRPSDQAGWTKLPARREGPVPPWPLVDSITRREQEIWDGLWALPQALMWEASNQHHEVAVYARTAARAEALNAPSTLLTLYRQQREELGLSQSGLARRRWRLVAADTAPAPREARTRDARRASDKARFQVIEGEAAKAG